MRLCGAAFSEFYVNEDGQARVVAVRGAPKAFAKFRSHDPSPPVPGSITARVLSGGPSVHTTDVKDHDLYHHGDPYRRALVDLGGARASLAVILIKDRAVLGGIDIFRQEVRPFFGSADRAIAEFRRPGCDHDGKCASVDRDARGLGAETALENLGFLRSAYAAVDAADLKSCSCEMSRLV
jgi:hypothetical protein